MNRKPEMNAMRIGDHKLTDLEPVRAGAVAVAALVATLIAFAGSAEAAPGDLDPTFNGSGLLSLAPNSASAVVQQTDSKLVLAGMAGDFDADGFVMMVARVAEDGTLDSSFGSNGIAFADFAGLLASASVVIQQTDGKLVLAGRASGDVALARFNASGTLDASFGNGGKATLDIGSSDDSARGLIEHPGGKYVIAGETIAADGRYQLVFARFNADGTPDTSFGTDGTTLVDFGSGTESLAGGVARQADGKFVAVGSVYGATGSDVGIVRVTADGTLDPSFDGDGLVIIDNNGNIDEAFAVALQPDHAIVVAGVTAPDAPNWFPNALLLRVDGNGSVDNSFGARALPDTTLNSIVLQDDGKLVATGARYRKNEGVDLILARFNSDGALDKTYGVDGVATADFGVGGTTPYSWGDALIRQIDGKYVAAGRTGIARFDDDAAFAGRIGLTITHQDALETKPTVSYTVRRTGGTTGVVSVTYATSSAQAQAGSDFEDASGTLTWNDGEASDKTLTINLINDSVTEADETFRLLLSTPTGGAHLAATQATTLIVSQGGSGELWFRAAGILQVSEGGGLVVNVAVERSTGSTGAASVTYSTFTGTATAGEDFRTTSGTLSWADGETGAQSFEVAILDDSTAEGDEEFEIRLSDPTGGATIAASGGTQRVLIRDNEASPSPSLSPPPVNGGGGSDGFLFGLLLLGLARRRGINHQTHFFPNECRHAKTYRRRAVMPGYQSATARGGLSLCED